MIITFFFQRQSMLNKYNTPKLNVGSLKKNLMLVITLKSVTY